MMVRRRRMVDTVTAAVVRVMIVIHQLSSGRATRFRLQQSEGARDRLQLLGIAAGLQGRGKVLRRGRRGLRVTDGQSRYSHQNADDGLLHEKVSAQNPAGRALTPPICRASVFNSTRGQVVP